MTGASFIFPSKNWKEFMNNLFREYIAIDRKMIGAHSKTYILRNEYDDITAGLLTSCNLSKGGWGVLQKNNTSSYIRHYEMAVLYIPNVGEDKQVPLSYQIGGVVNSDEYWFTDIPKEEPDLYGMCYNPVN
eukprot:TRINITY_DN2208_c0_g1_i1.p1 TRINITY_DN2208_c0_g1~~TRINITY_DN2208_c0_g1_i1.p1  ORF type:complete len:131 (-),score=23.23 TRINITY_DN2208_c0_g1_i1:8-400(-)